ncbi:MAG TPA: iron-siderophore ABC transporter substrate-binding protein, partial [Arthrobacter sp.]|nr:iron-siderophore ABC transporter substrate-binding protein [Arthrobacter sp.]
MKTRITRQLTAAAAGLVLLATAACGSPAASTSSTATTAAAEAAGFPLTMDHTMGSTTIESAPKRVVALDPSYIDAALLLE